MESKFSALAAAYISSGNKRHRHPSNTNYEQDTKRRQVSNYCRGFPCLRRQYVKGNDRGHSSWFLKCSCSAYSCSFEFICFCAPLLLTLDVYTILTQTFVVAILLVPFRVPYPWNPTTELGVDNFSSLSFLFIHHVFLLMSGFPHHHLYSTLPWSVLGRLLCIQQVGRPTM